MRTYLGRVRGLGSAKEGVSHWWVQRLTAVALVPLSLWFVISVIGLAGADYATFAAWIKRPFNTAVMSILVGTVFYHAALGLQVVIEDYVHDKTARLIALIGVKFAAALLGTYAVVSILRVAFGG